VALVRWRDALSLGAAAGLAAGTAGFVSEWGWSQVFMPHAWTASMLPEAALLSAIAGTAAGIVGARIAAAIGGEYQPRLRRTHAATALVTASIAALVATMIVPLPRNGDPAVRATVTPVDAARDSANLRITFSKPNYSRDANWFEVLAWQGGSSERIALRQLSPTVYETAEPVPYGGNWKSMLRVAHGSKLTAAPVYLAREPLTGKPAVPLEQRTVPMRRDTDLLLRESKEGSESLVTPAYVIVGLIALGWLAALAFAFSRAEGPPPSGGTRGRHRARRPVPGLQH
jgi:uncharacterized membrane protein YeaQ/YmgE (transglycosylase-associated protein family)